MKTPKKTPPGIEKLLYGRHEAAFALGISARSIDSLIANRVIRPRRFGRRVLIPAADVQSVAARIISSDMLDGAASTAPES